MDYTAIFEISASGMDFQRLRMETIANNLANANTTRTASGAVYKPLEAVAHTAPAVAPWWVGGVQPSAVRVTGATAASSGMVASRGAEAAGRQWT